MKKNTKIESKPTRYTYYTLKAFFTTLVRIVYRIKCYGKENIPENGAIVLAGNHIHAYDPVIAVTYTNRLVHFFAKEEVSRGFTGFLMRKMGTIIVYRDRNKNVASVMESETILEKGGAVGIFPEGTRNRTDKDLLKFRHGAVSIAKKTNAKIVPFALRGKYRPFRKGLEIEYGKPIDVSNMDIEEANEILKEEVLKLLKKERKAS